MRKIVLGLLAAGAVALTWNALAQEPAKPAAGEQYTICVYESAAEFALRTDTTAKGQDYWKMWGSYMESLQAAGVIRGGMPFYRDTPGMNVTLQHGEQAKPAAASELELTGIFLIEVKDHAAALEWAGKVPNAKAGRVDLRKAFPAPKPAAK
jgi:hypothetical protein